MSISLPAEIDRAAFRDQLLQLCRNWSSTIHGMATRTNTHDMGFIVLPALRADWELTGNRKSLESVITAAHSLATRWNERVGAIRSWDQQQSKNYSITDMEDNFLVIIDSMCSKFFGFFFSLFFSLLLLALSNNRSCSCFYCCC